MTESIFDAYLARRAGAFFGTHFASSEDRRGAAERAERPVPRRVADALAAQNARYSPSTSRDANVAALRDGAVAAVSGQQVGLFLGPLFTLYKAASAVAVARSLAAELRRPVVPVFWLQTEDHDLPEIAESYVPCERGDPVALRVPSSPEERISIAHRQLPAETDACLDRLRAELANLPHAEPHLDRLQRHYRPGTGWASAFAGMIAEIFAGEGLVLLDPRDPDLAPEAAPIHRHALLRAEAIAEALTRRTAELRAQAYAPTVHVRAGAPLSFYHPHGADGPRFRLSPASGGFREVGGDGCHSLASLLKALADDPMRFSTSVLLRPILQDTFLPTAAFIGGPAEVAYFAQLAPLYQELELPMPLVVPRARFRLIEEKTARLLARLDLTSDSVALPEDDLLAAARGANSASVEPRAESHTFIAPVLEALEGIRAAIETETPELVPALEKTRQSVAQAVSKLASKYEKVVLHRDQKRVADVQRLKAALHPGGIPQERFYGFSYYAARYGELPFVRRVIDAVQPFDPTPKDVFLSGP